MKRMLLYITTILIPGLYSCGPANKNFSTGYRSITIDSSYAYYIREYYQEYDSSRNLLKSKQELQADKTYRLIEVEYLFVSKDDKNNVIYFTTVPDRRQMRYSENYLGPDSVNMHDVRMLHFGKIDSLNRELYLFTGFKSSERDNWHIKSLNNTAYIKVERIEEIARYELNDVLVVDSALADSVVFRKVAPFHLVYYNPKAKKGRPSAVHENRFYFHEGNPREIILSYGTAIKGKRSWQKFGKRHIVHDPRQVFDN